MKSIDFAKARRALPPYCLTLMQNVPREDQQVLEHALEALDKRDAEPSVKSLLSGVELIDVVGLDVLATALKSLEDQVRSIPEA